MSLAMPKLHPCPFCEYIAGEGPCAFVSRGPLVSAFMNRAQYERGAVLVVPNLHAESIFDLDPALHAAVYAEVVRVGSALVSELGANGLGVFQNNGSSAGQTVPHFHVHVIPRYADSEPLGRFREEDFPHTGFEDLEKLAAQLRAGLAKA